LILRSSDLPPVRVSRREQHVHPDQPVVTTMALHCLPALRR
jgi:hypothetical protein